MTTTPERVTSATRHWHTPDGRHAVLQYRYLATSGRHEVRLYAGEDGGGVWRSESVCEMRARWRIVCDRLRSEGYEPEPDPAA